MENQCEFCGRPIKSEPEVRIRRGKKHIYCSEVCFRLDFYDAPTMSYEDFLKMYELRCVSISIPTGFK